jgi:hypothetical protein
VLGNAYASGMGINPVLDGSTKEFVGVTVTINVASGEKVMLTANFLAFFQKLGGPSDERGNFIYAPCVQAVGSLNPPGFLSERASLQLEDTTDPYAVTGIFQGLSPGDYVFGMCARGSSVTSGTWSTAGSDAMVIKFN